MAIEWKGLVAYLGDRKLGFINFENVFVSPREPKHRFQKLNGWGMAEELIYDLLERKITNTVIMVRDDNRVRILKVTTDTWIQKGYPYHHKAFEKQYILPEKDFDKIVENVE